MSKVELETLASGYLDVEVLNRNFAAIETWADSVLSRTGQAPNQMNADIDLNGYQLLNAGSGINSPGALVTVAGMEAYVDSRASGIVRMRKQEVTAVASQTVVPITSFQYQPGADNLAVYVNGVRKFAPTDYTETSSSSITFLTPLTAGNKVLLLSTEFLGNVVLPYHTHSWADVFDKPATATRWPTFAEVTARPSAFPPEAHTHSAADIATGRLADAQRGVYVQPAAPSSPQPGDLWLW